MIRPVVRRTMRVPFSRLGIIVAMLMLAACNASDVARTGPPREPDGWPARTDSLVYRLVRTPGMYRAYVTATYTNSTGAPVYFARCGRQDTKPMYGVRRTGPDSTARLFGDWAWACVGGVPLGALAPGTSVTVRAPLGSFDQPNMSPPLEPANLVGTMRVMFSICKWYVSDSDHCEAAPDAQRQSNAFLVAY